MYTAKGYAYAGAGAKIIRVEISLDDGKLWRAAEIRRFEKPNAYGEIECSQAIFLRLSDFLPRPCPCMASLHDSTIWFYPLRITDSGFSMISSAREALVLGPLGSGDPRV